MNKYLLFDVGGTGVKYAFFDEKGNMISSIKSFPSPSKKSKSEIISAFSNIIKSEQNVTHIAMAWPGPFDYKRGISLMDNLGKYQSIYGLEFEKEIKHDLNRDDLVFKFDHDIRAFALGFARENHLEKESIISLIIGTGAGSAFYQNSKCVGSEVEGVPDNGWIYNSPFNGLTIEDWISSKGIEKLANKYFNKSLDGKTLYKMAEAGNINAINLFYEFGSLIKGALTPFVSSFKPSIIVFGGKISNSYKYFAPAFLDEYEKKGIKLILTKDNSYYAFKGLFSLFEDNL